MRALLTDVRRSHDSCKPAPVLDDGDDDDVDDDVDAASVKRSAQIQVFTGRRHSA